MSRFGEGGLLAEKSLRTQTHDSLGGTGSEPQPAVASSRPFRAGPARSAIGRRLRTAFAVVSAAVLVLGSVSVVSTLRLRRSREAESHTYEVLVATSTVQRLVTDAETSTRGFAITGAAPYLEPYERSVASIRGDMARLRELTQRDPAQRARTETLARLVDAQMAYWAENVATARVNGLGPARARVQTGTGKRGTDAIRHIVAEIEADERSALAERHARSEAQDLNLLLLQVALVGVMFGAAWLTFLVVRHHLAERQRAEEELNRFFDLSIDLLAISSADGHFRRLSPAFKETLGWDIDEMIERPYLDFVHRDDVEATRREVERQVERGETVMHFENRYRHKDGSWRTLSWRSAPGPGGLMYASARDITEQRRLERLREQVDRDFRALFESLPGAYVVLRPDLSIAAVSDAYLAAAMTTREALIGRRILEAFPDNPDEPEANGVANLQTSLERVLMTLAPDTMPIQRYDVVGADGRFEERYWSSINSPVPAGDGTLAYVIHRVEDVTEFVKRQGDGAGGAASLTARMQQMAAEIYNSAQASRVANEKLREANAEMEAFSYSVSHDLRAPLRHVQGYVQMLTRETAGQLSGKAARYLEVIRDASRDMGVLIDDLLSFSRMARAPMQRATVELDALVADVVASLRPECAGRRVDWEVADLGTVKGDAAMLRQVFANLLGNAVKYTRPREAARIEVGTMRETDGETRYFVRDNGVGFDPRFASKLFGVFQRLHRADEFEGSGIGLANVRRIVGRHGGKTWAEGRPGEGATFHFSLPGSGSRADC